MRGPYINITLNTLDARLWLGIKESQCDNIGVVGKPNLSRRSLLEAGRTS